MLLLPYAYKHTNQPIRMGTSSTTLAHYHTYLQYHGTVLLHDTNYIHNYHTIHKTTIPTTLSS